MTIILIVIYQDLSFFRFSVLEKGKWIECLNLDENSTTLDVRFNTPRDIQKIRCPFKINANPREAKAYMIRVETNYKSEIAAAIPMLAPPEEVSFLKYFSCLILFKFGLGQI